MGNVPLEDTSIDLDELNDLDQDQSAANMRKSLSRTPKKASKKSGDSLSEDVAKMSMKTITNFSMDFFFHHSIFSNPEGHKDIIYIDILTMNLPKYYLREAKVLKGDLQFSVLSRVQSSPSPAAD